tara:strand:+ start:1208 stop:1750 length:543 start_codon:yes stop_codon:yes gene_type:complete
MSKNECLELKNINYQTMLHKKNKNISSHLGDTFDINKLLKNEKMEKKNRTGVKWNKLEKTYKLYALMDYANNYDANEKKREKLKKYLRVCLERKKLKKIKDVEFDIESGKILNIPNLIYHPNRDIFVLRSSVKKTVTKKNISKTKKAIKKKNSRKKSEKRQSPKRKNKTNKMEKHLKVTS